MWHESTVTLGLSRLLCGSQQNQSPFFPQNFPLTSYWIQFMRTSPYEHIFPLSQTKSCCLLWEPSDDIFSWNVVFSKNLPKRRLEIPKDATIAENDKCGKIKSIIIWNLQKAYWVFFKRLNQCDTQWQKLNFASQGWMWQHCCSHKHLMLVTRTKTADRKSVSTVSTSHFQCQKNLPIVWAATGDGVLQSKPMHGLSTWRHIVSYVHDNTWNV